MEELTTYSPKKLSKLIWEKQVSPITVVEAHIQRIKKSNRNLNAVVVPLFSHAINQAKKLKDNLDSYEERPPLLGVPFTTKEMISVEDQPITCGSVKRSSARSTKDAKIIEILKRSGAIPLGLTNVPELGLWIETNNQVYGKTHNPHDRSRTPGGSSGGEGAIIASGGVPFGVGSDVGGSIRIPSLFCGIYGHKSTSNTVDQLGHFPVEHSSHQPDLQGHPELIAIGPMTRHASDLKMLVNTFSNFSLNAQPQTEENSGANQVFVLDNPSIKLASSTSKPQRDAVRKASNVLGEHGAELKYLQEDYFYQSTALYTGYLEDQDLPDTDVLAGGGQKINPYKELLRSIITDPNHTLPMLFLSLFERFFTPSDEKTQKIKKKLSKLRNDLYDKLHPNGLLIMPPFPTSAPSHGSTLLKPFDLMYSGIFNVLDFPVTTVPIGTDNDGLPTGVQVISAPGRDIVSLEAAELLESELGIPKSHPSEETHSC